MISRFIAPLFLLLLMQNQLFGQNVFKAGLEIGLNTSQIDGDGYAGFDKAGIILGGFTQIKFSKKLKGKFSIDYIQKGSTDPAKPKIGKLNYTKIALHYLEVPLSIMVVVNPKWNFIFGPSFARLFSDSQRDASGKIIPIIIPKENEYGYFIGGSYAFNPKLEFDFRYAASLLPIANNLVFDPARLGFFGGSYNIALAFRLNYILGKTSDQ